MHNDAIQAILDRADDVVVRLKRQPSARSFVMDLLEFVKHIVPVIAELQTSLAQTSEKLPTASQQLNKVTEANEVASTQILDIVERILTRVQDLHLVALENERDPRIIDIGAVIAQLEHSYHTEVGVAELATMWHGFIASRQQQNTASVLDGIQNDCTNIMIALQVQDITTQQIAGVNKLMQSVDEGLQVLLRHIHEEESTECGNAFNHKHLDIAHDTGADYLGSDRRQQIADKIVKKHATKRKRG